ncbi:MAG TPA: ring-cleaving dioxygenase [Opitutaceae bacterium]|nr:ring-cleaving dioxygenase [Opitutaceae bacterium]
MGRSSINGLHHVTAICGHPQANHRFYTGVLGLRLVKRTVNFDDPGTYHLYYGDGAGSPGTILTFFPWMGVPNGRLGTGMAVSTAFRTGEASLGWWKRRLEENKVVVRGPLRRFDESFLEFSDPDGLVLEIVAPAGALPATVEWAKSPVPSEHALRGFHTVSLSEATQGFTGDLVTAKMGYRLVGEEGGRFRYAAPGAAGAALLDILASPGGRPGLQGAGTVHHVAFRVQDDTAQLGWLEKLQRSGLGVSPVMDRSYFHSIYYREPGGVLFEIATDSPGFATDEPAESLGERLMLPRQYEAQRAQIERALPPL